MRSLAFALAGALLLVYGCGDGPSRPLPVAPSGPDRPLRWLDVPERIGVGRGERVSLTLHLSEPVEQPTLSVSYGFSRHISIEDLSSPRPGVVRFTIRGRLFGELRVQLEAEAIGYEIAVAELTVVVTGGDFSFNESKIWRELAFNALECPNAFTCDGALESRTLQVLDTPSPNFYIRTHSGTNTERVSPALAAQIRELIREIVPRITGMPFAGRIESGASDRNRAGWITVILTPPGGEREVPPDPGGACGLSKVGELPGRIFVVQSADCDDALTTLRHEIGHAMGFWHVEDTRLLMHLGTTPGTDLTPVEQELMNLAYRLGRGTPYRELSDAR